MISYSLGLIKQSVRFYNIQLLHLKYSFAMEKAYLRHLTDQFQITFQYNNPGINVKRQFNFCRQSNEPVSSFLSRVITNVEKVISKKSKKKKHAETKGENTAAIPASATLLVDNVEVDAETCCSEVFQPGKNITLRVCDCEYSVIINSPWIDSIALPKSILANFPVYPSKFDAVFTEKSLSEFSWYRLKDKAWILVGNEYIYTPSNDDINSPLKLCCLPKNALQTGPQIEVISDVAVDASPGLCPFEGRHNFTKERLKDEEFRVVSYNILADLYCDSDFTRTELFPYCPPYALAIDYRKQLIVKELIGYNADIICLQEVDRKVYNYDLQPVLSYLGYGNDFCIKGGEVAEGLACFFYKSRFSLLESHRIVLAEHVQSNPIFSDIWDRIATNPKLVERFLERPNTVQALVLQSLEHNSEVLVVANTHLYFHPDADHIRLLQGGLAIRYLENLVSNLKSKHTDKRISLIFCGDFNSVPECGIYKLYTTGSVPADFIDFSSNKEEMVKEVNLRQSFELDSACGTPKYTNFTAGFQDCLDYIFYEKTNLQVSQIIPLPTLEELNQNTALPSIVFPSDHVSLVANLKWQAQRK